MTLIGTSYVTGPTLLLDRSYGASSTSKESSHYEYHGKDPGGPCSHGTSTAATVGADTPPSDGTEATSAPSDATPATGGLTWVAPAQDATVGNGFVVKTPPTSRAS